MTTTTTTTPASDITLGELSATVDATNDNNDTLQAEQVIDDAQQSVLDTMFESIQAVSDDAMTAINKVWLVYSLWIASTFGTTKPDKNSSEIIRATYQKFGCSKNYETTWRYLGLLIAHGLDISLDKLVTINKQTKRQIPITASILGDFQTVIRSRKILDMVDCKACLNDMFEFLIENGITDFKNEYPRDAKTIKKRETKPQGKPSSEVDTDVTATPDDDTIESVEVESVEVEVTNDAPVIPSEDIDIALSDATEALAGHDHNKGLSNDQSLDFNALLDAVSLNDLQSATILKLNGATPDQIINFVSNIAKHFDIEVTL